MQPAVWKNTISTSTLEFSLSFMTLLFYQVCVSGQEILSVRISTSSDYFEEKKPAWLRCVVATPANRTSEDLTLSWTRAGGLPESSSISNTPKSGIDVTSTLTFNPGALDNMVPILCTAQVGSASGSASYLPKVILVPDDPVIMAPTRADPSGTLTWTCQSDGASQTGPNVYWRNGRGAALTSGVSRTITVKQKPNENVLYSINLTITLQAKDFLAAQSLVCVVVHGLADYFSRRSATQVLALPEVRKSGGDLMLANEFTRQTLSCNVLAGFPPDVNITWIKDGLPVTLSSPGRYDNLTNSDLVIRSVTKYDKGDYLCSATSLLGTVSFISSTTLIVRYRPSVYLSTNESTVEGTIGEAVFLPCTVDSFPYSTCIQWNRVIHGYVFVVNTSSNPRYLGGSATNQQYGLTIKPLEESDEGTYFCEATNEIGRDVGPNTTLVIISSPTPSPRALVTSASTTAVVVLGVLCLVFLVVIIIVVFVCCYLCKYAKGHERARVGPLTLPEDKGNAERLVLPPLNPEPGNPTLAGGDLQAVTTPGPLLPPARPGDDYAENFICSSQPGESRTPVLRLPPLDPEFGQSDTPFRWSAPRQDNFLTPHIFKVSNGATISSLDQTSVLKEKLAMMK